MAENLENDTVEEQKMECDDDDDSSSDEDELLVEKISQTRKQVEENPYLYESHVELIDLLRQQGELDELREARENMSRMFPLTEKLWLDWLEDEKKVEESRDKMIALFDRAVEDYLSVEIWLEYAQYTVGGIGEPGGIEEVRKVFERALSTAGLHVPKGCLLWEAYREFENAILGGLQPPPGGTVSSEQQQQLDAQTKKINELYRRQLSVPLEGMEETWEELQTWLGEEEVDSNVKQQYEKALAMLKTLLPFEDALAMAEPPRSAEYAKCLDLEMKSSNPARVQCMFERAVVENCLDPKLWKKYLKYMDEVLDIESETIKTFERALRNCPWSGMIWDSYVRVVERYHPDDHQKLKQLFEQALLGNNFQHPSDYLLVWTSYCDYMRRRIDWEQEHEKELEDLRSTFENAIDFMTQRYPVKGDPDCTLMLYWARIEAKFCRNMDRCRQLWNDALQQQGHHAQASWWLEYFQLERAFGDHKHARRVLERALNQVTDWPDSIALALVNYEREEGTLEQLERALEKNEAYQQRQQERRDQEAAEAAKFREKKQQEKKARQKKWEKQEESANHDSSGSPPKKGKAAEHGGSGSANKKEKKNVEGGNRAEMIKKQQELLKARQQAMNKLDKPDPDSNPKPASTDPDGFKVPTLPAPSPVKKRSAPPPGYRPPPDEGQVEEPPLKKPKVSDQPSESSHPAAEDDPGRLERSVFVSNLEYNVEENDLMTVFSDYGSVHEIRLARDVHTKKSRGFGFIEFSTKAEADKAKTFDRRPLNGRPMFISDCNPENRKGFQYSADREQNKLFVKGLPPTATKEALENLFGQHGKLVGVRIVTYRNGVSKGIAYVEYVDKEDAAKAVLKTDGIDVGNCKISVDISNPPPRKQPIKSQKKQEESVAKQPSLGGGKRENIARGGKAHTMLAFQPRSIKAKTDSDTAKTQTEQDSSTSTTPKESSNSQTKTGLSNSEFRKMFLK